MLPRRCVRDGDDLEPRVLQISWHLVPGTCSKAPDPKSHHTQADSCAPDTTPVTTPVTTPTTTTIPSPHPRSPDAPSSRKSHALTPCPQAHTSPTRSRS